MPYLFKTKSFYLLIFIHFFAFAYAFAQKETKLTYRNEKGEALEYIYVISYDAGKYAYESGKVKKTALKTQKHAYPITNVILGKDNYTIKAGLEAGLSFTDAQGKEKIFRQELTFVADDKSGDTMYEMGIGIFGFMSGKKGAKLVMLETVEGSAYKNIWEVRFPGRKDIVTMSYEKANKVLKCTTKSGKSQTFLFKK